MTISIKFATRRAMGVAPSMEVVMTISVMTPTTTAAACSRSLRDHDGVSEDLTSLLAAVANLPADAFATAEPRFAFATATAEPCSAWIRLGRSLILRPIAGVLSVQTRAKHASEV